MTYRMDEDDRVTFAIEKLLDPGEAWRPLVRDLVTRWPDSPPLEIVFALVSASVAIETNFAHGSPARDGAAQGYRLAALLSVDLYAMETLGIPRKHARSFLSYWAIDPFFSRL